MDGLRFSMLILFCITLTYRASAAEFGVGFSLSFDYGTTSIYYANGSSIAIAKVEGGLDYKQMMRAQTWSLPQQGFHDRDYHPIHRPTRMTLHSLRDHLPPWLGGTVPNAQVETLTRMLRALKTATDSYIGTKIEHAEVGFPARPPQQLLDTLDSASSAVSLKMPVLLQSPAGQLAAYANGLSGKDCCSHDLPAHLLLAVDYSRAALTAMLYCQEYGLLDAIRGMQNTTLGADHWSLATRDQMIIELSNIMKVPVEAPSGTRLNRVERLVLLGENGADERLRGALMEAFGDTDSHKNIRTALIGGYDMVDPVFAAAIGTAAACLVRLDHAERGGLCSVPIEIPSRELR